MSKRRQRWVVAAWLVICLMGMSGQADAQFNFNPNMNPGLVSGLNQAQYMAYLQQAAAARAAFQGQPLFPATNPAGVGVNPYSPVTANPYGTGVTNPYSPVTSTGVSPYDTPYINPYQPYVDAGSVLRGQADVMRAYGTVITSQEQARIIREQALQEKLNTRKKKFDLDMYIKANTPTFTEEQSKIAKMTLKRIQTNSSEPEIVNGKALNLLLDDMRKYPGKRAAVEPFALSEDVLGHLNVTKGTTSLGILRNRGEFAWPIVFQEYFPPEQLTLIENQAKSLVKNAEQGKPLNVNVLKDMRLEVDKVRDQLFKKINEIPPTQYLEAKRFLNDFDEARMAIERGEALTQVVYQKWTGGGKNLQQLVDYMIANGMRFTPSTLGDEFAYRAVYSGMVALDVGLNTVVGGPAVEPSEPKENP